MRILSIALASMGAALALGVAPTKAAPTLTVPFVVVIDETDELDRGLASRFEQHMTTVLGQSVSATDPSLLSVAAVRVPPDPKYDPDANDDAVKNIEILTKSRDALGAFVGDAGRASNGAVVMRGTLVIPQAGQRGLSPWTVRIKGRRVQLPLGYGTFRFDMVSVAYKSVAAADPRVAKPQTPNSSPLAGVNRQLKRLPLVQHLYASNPNATELGVAAFTAGLAAYHSGDFNQAERLFATAEEAMTAGSNIRYQAALMHLASASRAALAEEAGRPGFTKDFALSREARHVEEIGRAVRSEYPWSVAAVEVLGTYHLGRAESQKGSLKRETAKGFALRYADAAEKLLDKSDAWLDQARPAIAAISLIDD